MSVRYSSNLLLLVKQLQVLLHLEMSEELVRQRVLSQD